MIAVVVLVLAGLLSLFVYNSFFRDLAKEAAAPLEKNLTSMGAVKKCDSGSPGLGPDNRAPWYSAIYEAPKDQEATISLIQQAAKDNGFSATEIHPNINVLDNRFFEDATSKKSMNSSLKDGNVKLNIEVFGSKEHNAGDQFCTVKDSNNKSKTTFSVQISLPEYK